MKLAVQNRTLRGKKVRSLRKDWIVPAVVYWKHLDGAMPISVNKIQLVKTYHKTWRSTPVELTWDLDELVLFQDIQLDPVTDHVIHVDFIAVKRDVKVTAEVPVILKWVSPFEKNALWRVQLLKSSVEVEAFPMDLPHDITIDVSWYDHEWQVLFAKDLPLSSKVELMTDPELAILSTVAFIEEVEEVEEAIEAIEPVAPKGDHK